MEATVYRRGSDGKIIGVPEGKPVTEKPVQPVFSVSTYRASEISQTRIHSKIAASESKPVAQVQLGSEEATTIPVRKMPSVKMLKIFNRKSKSRYPRPVRYLRNTMLAYLGFYLVLGIHTATSLNKVSSFSNVTIADTSGTNWLLVGSDSREGLTSAERKELRTGKDEGAQRTDTLMLINISESGKPTLVSLPRDSYVTIPAHVGLDGVAIEDRRNKINTAYSKGGAPLLVETVERNTGLHIDHYMEIGFKGIRDLTDAVGGVNMCVPADVTDENSGLNLQAGCQKLDGKNALAYVRMRYADPKGDLGRIERQQQYLSSLMKRVANPQVLLNPISIWKLTTAGTDSVNVGASVSIIDISKLARAMQGLSNGNGILTTVQVSQTNAETAAGSSVIWDDAAARELFISLGAN